MTLVDILTECKDRGIVLGLAFDDSSQSYNLAVNMAMDDTDFMDRLNLHRSRIIWLLWLQAHDSLDRLLVPTEQL